MWGLLLKAATPLRRDTVQRAECMLKEPGTPARFGLLTMRFLTFEEVNLLPGSGSVRSRPCPSLRRAGLTACERCHKCAAKPEPPGVWSFATLVSPAWRSGLVTSPAAHILRPEDCCSQHPPTSVPVLSPLVGQLRKTLPWLRDLRPWRKNFVSTLGICTVPVAGAQDSDCRSDHLCIYSSRVWIFKCRSASLQRRHTSVLQEVLFKRSAITAHVSETAPSSCPSNDKQRRWLHLWSPL